MSSSSKKKKKKVTIKSKPNKHKKVGKKGKLKKKSRNKKENEQKSKQQRRKILEIRKIQSRCLLPEITDQDSNDDIKQKQETIIKEYTYKTCIVCGPSGVGKGTLLNKIKKVFPNIFGVAVSHTTRQRRTDEIDGEHYNYISREEFETGIKNGEFVEYVDLNGDYYGTSIKSIHDVQKQKLICILEIDVEGADNVKKSGKLDAYYLFITCHGGLATLRERMKHRNEETDEQIIKRLETADKEFMFLNENNDFFDGVIYNDDLEEATKKLIEQFKGWYSWIHEIKDDEEERKIDDDDDSGSVIFLELSEFQEDGINALEVAFEEYDEDYYGFIEYDKFLSILKENGINLSNKEETFLMIALVLVDEGVDYYDFVRILRHKAAESLNDSLTKICQQIAIDAQQKTDGSKKSDNNNNDNDDKEELNNNYYEVTQNVRCRGMSLMTIHNTSSIMPSTSKIRQRTEQLTLDGVDIDFSMLKTALSAIGCNPIDNDLIFLMNYLAANDNKQNIENIENKMDANDIFIDFNYFISFCQEVSNIPATDWKNPGKIIESVARQTRIIYRTQQRGKRDKLKAKQRLENRNKLKKNKNKNKNNKLLQIEAEEKRLRALRLREKAKMVSTPKTNSNEERLKLNEWINKREKKENKKKKKKKNKTESKNNEIKKWMQRNDIFMKELLNELNINDIITMNDLKCINTIKMDKILRNVRADRFEKIKNQNSRNNIDKLLVNFEKKWKKITNVNKKKNNKKIKK